MAAAPPRPPLKPHNGRLPPPPPHPFGFRGSETEGAAEAAAPERNAPARADPSLAPRKGLPNPPLARADLPIGRAQSKSRGAPRRAAFPRPGPGLPPPPASGPDAPSPP